MNSFRVRTLASLTLVAASIVASTAHLRTHVIAAPAQLPMDRSSGFLGQWCAQGDRTKRCSITANGPFFTLTNEQGSTSTGTVQGMNSNTISADQWQFVKGTLSSDGTQIN